MEGMVEQGAFPRKRSRGHTSPGSNPQSHAPAMHRSSPSPDACDAAPAGACAAGPASDAPAAPVGPGRVVWLRANPRPGIVMAVVATLLLGLLVVLWFLARSWLRQAGWGAWLAGGGVAVAGVCGVLVSSRARIVLDGGRVVVRLRPAGVESVPLEAVECFFLGSRLEPPPPGDHRTGGERVRTLVMRIAERAVEFADRRTLVPWGRWEEGSVTFDGRWCEPLSVDLVRRLNRQLAAAKRARAAAEGEGT